MYLFSIDTGSATTIPVVALLLMLTDLINAVILSRLFTAIFTHFGQKKIK